MHTLGAGCARCRSVGACVHAWLPMRTLHRLAVCRRACTCLFHGPAYGGEGPPVCWPEDFHNIELASDLMAAGGSLLKSDRLPGAYIPHALQLRMASFLAQPSSHAWPLRSWLRPDRPPCGRLSCTTGSAWCWASTFFAALAAALP
jgi:hypothetical protein